MVRRKSTWKPAHLEAREDLAELHYAVVEEAMGDVVVLLIAPWPEAAGDEDERARGERPYFPYDVDETVLAADRVELESHLLERRLDALEGREDELSAPAREELRGRALSVGDVFGLRLAPGAEIPAAPDAPLRDFGWIAEAIDVTTPAREAAKQKMYEALTPPLKDEVAGELLDEAEDEG